MMLSQYQCEPEVLIQAIGSFKNKRIIERNIRKSYIRKRKKN